jgi:hypothetical protein
VLSSFIAAAGRIGQEMGRFFKMVRDPEAQNREHLGLVPFEVARL